MTADIVQAFIQIIVQFIDLPSWLAFSGNIDMIADLLTDNVPELAAGVVALSARPFERLALKNSTGCWSGIYEFDVVVADRKPQPLLLEATLFAPNLPLRRLDLLAALAGVAGSLSSGCS